MFYSSSGRNSIPVVLIHGYCENASVWDPLLEQLPESFNYIIPELPGFGNTPSMEDVTMKMYADFVMDIIKEVTNDEVIVIGHSMGGYIALELAENNSARIKGLGLFHSHPYADDETKIANRKKAIQFIEERGAIPYIEQFVPALFSPQHREAKSPYIQLHLEQVISTPAAGLIGGLQAMIGRSDRTSVLKNATFPVMIMAGKFDSVIPIETALKAAQLAAFTQVELLPASAHMGMFEETGSCVKGISEFLETCLTLPA